MQQFISYPSIDQFRNTVKAVSSSYAYLGQDEKGEPIYDRTLPKPTIHFTGTIKLHGTNASVVLHNDELYFQSRNRIITPLDDNAGFAAFAHARKDVLKDMLNTLKTEYNVTNPDSYIVLFGEWCGGNIQKDVAISHLDKRFVIFGARMASIVIKDEVEELSYTWLRHTGFSSIENAIYNIEDFTKFEIDIDYECPEKSQNILINTTQEVEKECPFAKAFDISGIGEGVVYKGWYRDNLLMFKVKGEEHSSSKVKTLAAVDIEKLETMNEFVESVVTESRLNQAIEYVFTQNGLEPDVKQMGSFIKWICEDIIKEELDTITGNDFNIGKVKSAISSVARNWFFNLPL